MANDKKKEVRVDTRYKNYQTWKTQKDEESSKPKKVKARNTIGMSDELAGQSGARQGKRAAQKGKEANARARRKTTVYQPKKPKKKGK